MWTCFQGRQRSSPIASCRHSQTVAPADDITPWCIAVITVPLNESHMSHAPAAQRGRSHQETQITGAERRRREAFNVFDLFNEGRASCRESVTPSRSLSLIWSLVGLKQLQTEKHQRVRKSRSHVFQTHSQWIKEVNERTKKEKRFFWKKVKWWKLEGIQWRLKEGNLWKSR